ncbi:MAG: transcriptional repressor [Dermatophilaceae bacterium]|jgi:Fur family ferric uptake transcriptional regulator|nr:transcriptional repressor [Dermatophilaceae bacterium]
MTASGRRPTRQQAAVVAYLGETGDFVSAQELHARMRAAGNSIGLATVYRSLAALATEGALDVLRTDDGEAVYRQCSTDHHHHLVCRTCGRTVEVAGPTVEAWAERVAGEHGFRDVRHTVEIVGTCATC